MHPDALTQDMLKERLLLCPADVPEAEIILADASLSAPMAGRRNTHRHLFDVLNTEGQPRLIASTFQCVEQPRSIMRMRLWPEKTRARATRAWFYHYLW